MVFHRAKLNNLDQVLVLKDLAPLQDGQGNFDLVACEFNDEVMRRSIDAG